MPESRWPHSITLRDGRAAVIRPAQRSDAEALIAAVDAVSRERAYFLRSSFRQNVEVEREFIAQSQRNGGLMLVARVEQRLAGWLTLLRNAKEFRRHTAELGIGVLGDYRGLGIGRALIEDTLAWCSGTDIERVELGVRASNGYAHALYQRLGFVEEGRRPRAVRDDAGNYDDEILMAYFVTADK